MITKTADGHLDQKTGLGKCDCCPYGYHIDLDFVNFVENVARGVNARNSLSDGYESRRNLIKSASTNGEVIRRNNTTLATTKRAQFSPFNSIFSDSLENVVSDFEETFNARNHTSDRESAKQMKIMTDEVRNRGYSSDYGATYFSRSLPPKIPGPLQQNKRATDQEGQTSRPQAFMLSDQDATTSSRKSSRMPFGARQQQAYCTALGRTISEIKSKHHDEHSEDLRETLFSRNGTNSRDRRHHFNSFHEAEQNRTLCEQDKVQYLGSKTSNMQRSSFTLSGFHKQYSSDTESVKQSNWRIRSPIQRSSTSVDMDDFASVRRRKMDDNSLRRDPKLAATPPLPYPRNCSLYAERLRHNLNFSQPSTDIYPKSRIFREMKMATGNCVDNAATNETMREPLGLTNTCVMMKKPAHSEIDSFQAKIPCLQCCSLQQQIFDLSLRLQQVGNEVYKKEAERKMISSMNKAPNLTFGDMAVETVKLETKDTAIDALYIKNEDKRTSVSLADQVEMNWYKEIAVSPIPQPKHYSIGISTDKQPIAPPRCHVMTNTPVQDGFLAPKTVRELGCCTEPILTYDRCCGNDMSVVMCDFSSVTDAGELLAESETENKQAITSLRDSSSMTTSVILISRTVQTVNIDSRTKCVSTSPPQQEHRSVEALWRISQKDSFTTCDDLISHNSLDAATEMDSEFGSICEATQKLCYRSIALQAEFEPEQSEPRVLNDSEIAESLWLMPSKEMKDVAVGNEEDVIKLSDIIQFPDKIKQNLRRELALHNVVVDDDDDDGDNDMICVLDEETQSDPEAMDFDSSKSAEQSPSEQRITDADNNAHVMTKNVTEIRRTPRVLGQARAAVVKKILTEKSPQLSFIRGTATSKSWRLQSKKGDSLQYVADRHKAQNGSIPSKPQITKGALKEKVILKKDVISSPLMPPSKVPEPVPARIPRPKISKYIPGETVPQSPDEEAEIADRLTPLRSEMRTLQTYTNGRVVMGVPRTVAPSPPPPSLPRGTSPTYNTNKPIIAEGSSSSSSDSEGSYDTNEAGGTTAKFELTPQLNKAIEYLKKHFQKSDSIEPAALNWATKHAKHEWLKTAARKTASADQVEGFIDFLEATSEAVLRFVVNLTDPNENTALHYAVSHGNFDVVSVLLDSRACNLNRTNKAGYTAVMLAALCDASDEVEAAVIHRLFQLGDVNAQAVQHGQTALMLAVSHGKINTTKLLIDCQADLNIQDEEGSTALMCAAEHGHKDVVKLLLAQPDIDASLSDCDSSTALSIAVENGHRDIGVLIYAHLNHPCRKSLNER